MQATHNSDSSTMYGTKDAMKDYSSGQGANDARLPEVASKAVSDVASKAAASVRSLLEDGRAMAAERLDETSQWVGEVTRERPMRTLGIVAAVGVIVGLLIARR